MQHPSIKMKTGRAGIRTSPETFYISLLSLDGILRRVSYKDCIIFKLHNPSYILSPELMGSAICFNLFSEHGVGKSLEPLLFELFKEEVLDYEKNKENIFYQEILNLANEVTPIIRRADSNEESDWSYKYAVRNLTTVDEISRERMQRLMNLFEFNISEEEIDRNYDDISREHIEDNRNEEGEGGKEGENIDVKFINDVFSDDSCENEKVDIEADIGENIEDESKLEKYKAKYKTRKR